MLSVHSWSCTSRGPSRKALCASKPWRRLSGSLATAATCIRSRLFQDHATDLLHLKGRPCPVQTFVYGLTGLWIESCTAICTLPANARAIAARLHSRSLPLAVCAYSSQSCCLLKHAKLMILGGLLGWGLLHYCLQTLSPNTASQCCACMAAGPGMLH